MTRTFPADEPTDRPTSPRRPRPCSGGLATPASSRPALRANRWCGLDTSRQQVGCGFATRQSPGGLRVLRLADGVSWFLPLQGAQWAWGEAIAATCTYFYASVLALERGQWISTIARVRLDSLGPGLPPD
jgi:hypothetical protein